MGVALAAVAVVCVVWCLRMKATIGDDSCSSEWVQRVGRVSGRIGHEFYSNR